MKRFLFLSMLAFIAVMTWLTVYEKENDTPLPQKLERAMRLTRMMTYQDDDFDYTIRYPAFFEQTDDSLMDKGSCRFSFWMDSTEIVQTAFVEPNTDTLTVEQGMRKYAGELSADHQMKGDDYFILSGALHDDNGHLTGRRFYAKFVLHRKLWFVQTLAYPEDCETAVQRLLKEIYNWQVWEDPQHDLQSSARPSQPLFSSLSGTYLPYYQDFKGILVATGKFIILLNNTCRVYEYQLPLPSKSLFSSQILIHKQHSS